MKTDSPTHIETHGLDAIPAAERHGRPRSLFWVWASANVIYVYFALGGLLVLLGLSIWEAIALTVLGNLWWIAVGWVATSGPAAGTPAVVIMRAIFGVRGNRVFGAGLNVLIGVFFEIVNIAFATLAAIALLHHLGIPTGGGLDWAVLIVVAVGSFVVSIYGHGMILKLSPIFTAALAVCFVVLAVFVFGAADFGYTPEPLPVADHWAVVMLGFAVVAATPLSWCTSADFSRYLPAETSRRGVMWWTALGGFIPAVTITTLGILAGTAIDMTDPQLTLVEIVPGWFYPVFLFVIVLGGVTNNVLTAYTTGLCFEAVGVRITRAWSTVLTGVVATILTAVLLFGAPRFIDTLGAALEISVAVLGPLLAVYVVDIWLRRGRYDGEALQDETPSSPFWYSSGVFWPGIIAFVGAIVVAVLSANTTLYQGPIVALLNGADLSALLGPLVAGTVYAVLWRRTRPYSDPALRPGAATARTFDRATEKTPEEIAS